MSRVIDIDRSRVRNFFHFQRDPLGFLVETADKGDVVSLRTGTFQSTYVVNSPEFIRALLVTHESGLVKGRSSNVLRRTVGDGLLTSEHNQHKQQRKYMQPAFYKERINSYARTVVEEAGKLADGLQNGSVIDVHEEMMQLTLSIITKTMFHASVDEDKQRLSDAVDTTIVQTAGTLFSPLILPLGFPTRGNRNHKHAISELETMIYNTLNRAKQQEIPDDSLLGMLLETKDEDGNPIPDEEIRDQMMTMLLAGHETTASLLTWVFFLLSKHPEAREKVLAEVKQCHKPYSFETFMQLRYTKQVIEETLRLYPPAWIILRESRQSINILGETFPDKSSFLISPYAIHRNPAVFQDPHSFQPERFSPGRSYEPYTYFPFGGGPRGCIGSRFAMMEAVLILAVLIEKAEFRHKEKEIIPEPLVSLRVKGGLKVSVELNG
ncbi:pyridine nucleotide-disulfide oxidoreductase [Bacillus sp. MUM 13]|nr:pyridine nucleotide-disulfide oxidoreductase [Bacillus sp. MUM 13]